MSSRTNQLAMRINGEAKTGRTGWTGRRLLEAFAVARVFYLHWNEAELAERLEALRGTGCEVDGWHEGREGAKKLTAFGPDVVVISLDRVPLPRRRLRGLAVGG